MITSFDVHLGISQKSLKGTLIGSGTLNAYGGVNDYGNGSGAADFNASGQISGELEGTFEFSSALVFLINSGSTSAQGILTGALFIKGPIEDKKFEIQGNVHFEGRAHSVCNELGSDVTGSISIIADSIVGESVNRREKDQVYVSKWDHGSPSVIYRVEPDIQGLIPIATAFDHLVLGACGPDGFLYFAERGKQQIIRVSQDGSQREVIYKTIGRNPWDAPEGPSFDQDGNLYFTNSGIGGLWIINNLESSKGAIQIGQQFGVKGRYIAGAGTTVLTDGPYSGDVLVSNLEKNEVYRIAQDDFCTKENQSYCGTPHLFISNLDHPYGIALNSQGEIYIGNYANKGIGYISKYTSSGKFLDKFTVGGWLAGIAFDSYDNLWAVTIYGVYKIEPNGEKTLVSAIPWEGAGIAICRQPSTASNEGPSVGSSPMLDFQFSGGTVVDSRGKVLGSVFALNPFTPFGEISEVDIVGPPTWNSDQPFHCFTYQPTGINPSRAICWVWSPPVTGSYSARVEESGISLASNFQIEASSRIENIKLESVEVRKNEVGVRWSASNDAKSFLARIDPVPWDGHSIAQVLVTGREFEWTFSELNLEENSKYEVVVFAFSQDLHDGIPNDLSAQQFNMSKDALQFIAR